MGKSKQNYDEAGAAVERGNNAARRRAEEYIMDLKSMAPVGAQSSRRPKERPAELGIPPEKSRRPKERPAELGIPPEKRYRDGGVVEVRGMKSCQMSGRNGGKIY